MDLLADLDENQRLAVTAPPEPLVVMAGAGSGKTTVLTRRIAWQIQQGFVNPEHVMACTFTKAAAGELSERVAALLEGRAAPACATFHSLMFRVLNSENEIHGQPRLQVCKDAERTRIIRDLLGPPSRDFPHTLNVGVVDVKEVGAIISACKNTLVHHDDDWVTLTADQNDKDTALGAAARLYPLYEAHLAKVGRLDFDDMVLRAYDLFTCDSDALHRAQNRWRMFSIDESQDLNGAQFSTIRLLAPAVTTPNLSLVGDPRQSLYGFRSSAPELMEQFERMYPGARRLDLITNYRSTPQVVKVANNLIAVQGLPAQEPSRDHGIKVRASRFAGQTDQATEIARFVEAMRAAGHPGSAAAVLVRTNAQMASIERAFVGARLPYFANGGGFLARMEVADILAYMRLAADRTDEQALRRIINRPTRYLGAAYVDAVVSTALTMRNEGVDDGLDLVEAMSRTHRYKGKRLSARQTEEVDRLVWLLDQLRTMTPTRAIRTVLDQTSYVEWLRKTEGVESSTDDSCLENIDALVELAVEFPTIAAILEYAEMAATMLRDSGDATEICTVHRSKGREWPYVLVSNFYDDSFPHKKADDVHEERRIAYVAFTRARDCLIVCVPDEDLYDKPVDPSRFLEAAGMEVDEPAEDDWWGDALVPLVSRAELAAGLAELMRKVGAA